ncbi:MAG: hypothetical protein ABIE03_05935 [Patescibacteria group bacterium]
MINIDLTELFKPLNAITNIVKEQSEIINSIFKELRNKIYIDPVTFTALAESHKLLDSDEMQSKSKNEKFFYVYTNPVKAPSFDGKYIEFDKKTAKLIKSLDMAFCHKFYSGIREVPFDKKSGILTIEDVTLKFDPDKEPARICNLLFGSKQYINKKRQWREIESKVSDHAKERDLENAIKLKVYRINLRIHEKTGYKSLIKFENKTLYVNPEYYYLFKE